MRILTTVLSANYIPVRSAGNEPLHLRAFSFKEDFMTPAGTNGTPSPSSSQEKDRTHRKKRKSEAAAEKSTPEKKTKKNYDARATSERERRQQIRDKILDLRDILPRFPSYLSVIPGIKDKRLRDMNTVETLNLTVQLLNQMLQDIEKKKEMSVTQAVAVPCTCAAQSMLPPIMGMVGQCILPSSVLQKSSKSPQEIKRKSGPRKKSSSESQTDRSYGDKYQLNLPSSSRKLSSSS